MQASDKPSCNPTRPRRLRISRALPVDHDPPESTGRSSVRDSSIAGASPNAIPTASVPAMPNATIRQSTCGARGSASPPNHRCRASSSQAASSAARAPPTTDISAVSVTIIATTRRRVAPRARRTPSSSRRRMPRASAIVAKFTAQSSAMTTAAAIQRRISFRYGAVNSPASDTTSEDGTRATEPSDSAARWNTVERSAFARSVETPGFNRPMVAKYCQSAFADAARRCRLSCPSGSQSCVPPGISNPFGITPTTSAGRPSTRIRRPTISSRCPNRDVQRPWERMTGGAPPPAAASASVNERPSMGLTPSTSK